MASRDIYETGLDEDIQTESRVNQCPERNGRFATNSKETICEDCGLVVKEHRIDHGPEWRAYDDEGQERIGAPIDCSPSRPGPIDGNRSCNRRERERTLREETAAPSPDAS